MKYIFVLVIATAFSVFDVHSQEKDTAINRQVLESQNYIFTAESVYPLRGTNRQLTSEYDVVVSKDTVISYLPYFGRVTSAPLNPDDAAIKFTSVDFSYSLQKNKKRNWSVTIRPKDARGIEELFFTVFDNGTAILLVKSSQREPITFHGYLSPREENKAK